MTDQIDSARGGPLDASADRSDRGFFGQPRVLANLFGVEMWERFSFYGMQGILAIYLYFSVAEGGLGIDTAVATGIVGAYGGGVYLATILGAWFADRVLGPSARCSTRPSSSCSATSPSPWSRASRASGSGWS